MSVRVFPGGPVVKNLPSNAGDSGSIPSQGTKISHASGATQSTHSGWRGAHVPQW